MTCDLCGRHGHCIQVDTKDFHGNFCSICSSMMEQTTNDDGSSRLAHGHLSKLQNIIRFNQNTDAALTRTGTASIIPSDLSF